MSDELSVLAEISYPGKCDLSDDAVIYSGSATWDDWRCHVPIMVVGKWKALDKEARAAVFLTAIAQTHFSERAKK